MHDLVVQMLLRPAPGAHMAWNEQICTGRKPYMICPAPAYDRHHAICEMYGIRMLPVDLLDDGPDMDDVEKLVSSYNVVGMWCIPKYSNPSGTTYSPEVCRRLSVLRGALGFRLIWDLAYQVHDLTDVSDEVPNMLELCRAAGDEDKVLYIGSTSKITHASAGVAILGASVRNLEWFKQGLTVQNIGPDKINQLHHVRFLKSLSGIRAHMRKHREIIRPKFDVVDEVLTRELGNRGIATWNKPRGGYFVSMQVKAGCAQRVVELAADIGVKLTPAGAAFPHGNDPRDSHIRLAPTFPPFDEVRTAMEVVALCVQIAAAE
jgi:DNA-binding transcriptional MocR family regulator